MRAMPSSLEELDGVRDVTELDLGDAFVEAGMLFSEEIGAREETGAMIKLFW
jgi:hypothetical protein